MDINLYYTPIAYSTVKWYINGKQYSEGKDLHYTATEAGSQYLKVVVKTSVDSTFREALINVSDAALDTSSLLSRYSSIVGETANMSVNYTSTPTAQARWYVDNILVSEGKTFSYTFKDAVPHNLRFVLNNQYDTLVDKTALLAARDPNNITNLALRPEVIATASGQAYDDAPWKAKDGNTTDGIWSDNASERDKWLAYDLGAIYNITKISIIWMSWDVSSKFSLQTSNDGVNWKDEVVETSNTANPTLYNVDWRNIRYVRIFVNKADDDAVRIHEFEVWGY